MLICNYCVCFVCVPTLAYLGTRLEAGWRCLCMVDHVYKLGYVMWN